MIRRILITGSRDWPDQDLLERAIKRAATISEPDAVLVHGDCRGVDHDAARVWKSLGKRVEAHPADWHTHGKAAGPIRNKQMVELGADMCIALIHNESRGASHCAGLAEQAGIKTYRIVS